VVAGLLKILFALIENVRRFFSCLLSSGSKAIGCSAMMEKEFFMFLKSKD